MLTAFHIIIVMAVLGLLFGLVLATANKKFSVEVNPLIHVIEDILPKGQCGACGFPGCQAYAEAVVLNESVAPNKCVPGGQSVADRVAELTGKIAEKIEPRVALIRCSGGTDRAVQSFRYSGIMDCVAASLVQGGPKGCKYGCMGFGTCVRNCPFGAISMGENGLPVVNAKLCTGCGACEAVCPKNVIAMTPKDAKVIISCNSKDKGAVARKLCQSACIGCGLCVKNCKFGAVRLENNLAIIDCSVCIQNNCTEPRCTEKCPTKAITLR